MTTTALATAVEIVRDAYRGSTRTDLDYHADAVEIVVLHDAETALCISDEWENGEHIGYAWTTWAMATTEEGRLVVGDEDSWDEGGSDSEAEARAHVASWLAATA